MENMITIIDNEFAKALLDSGEGTGVYEPKGLFMIKENDKYTGFDNSTGDCWVEDFATYEKCVDWLRGEKEVEKIPDIIGTMAEEIGTDNCNHSARIIEKYSEMSEEARGVVDDLIMDICGWSMNTLLGLAKMRGNYLE